MRLTLTHKIVISLVLAVLICCILVAWTSIYFMKKPLDAELLTNLNRLHSIVQATNDSTAERFARSAKLLAYEDELAMAIVARDHDAVMRLSKRAMDETGSDFMTVTDDKGTVVGRGHSKKVEDSVLNQETVVEALKGRPAAAIVAGTVVPFTIRASQPIIRDGKVIGTLSIGQSLVGPDYIDSLKKLTGMEVTVFKGDERVMTTIQKDGKRLIGTKMQNPEILEKVLRRGESIVDRNNIQGREYMAAYWPMRTADGKISGMWFVGAPLTELESLEHEAVVKSIFVALGTTLVMLILAIFIGIRMGAPVRKITEYIQAVSEGNSAASLDVYSKDDMGQMAESLREMVATQQHLLKENEVRAAAADQKAKEAEDLGRKAKQAEEEAIAAKREGMISAAATLEGVVTTVNDAIDSIAHQVQTSDHQLQEASNHLMGTSTAMDEMNSTVLEVARNVSLAANISNEARRKVADGAEIVNRSVAGIQEVHTQSLALKKDMEKLGEHARSIDKIMNVISDIADQTNLLALNAAIEAARAGDAGRGFAVVADEVRKLAEKTMTSTTEVGQAIQSIQLSTQQSAVQVDKAVQNIAQATEYSNKSGQLLHEILGMMEQNADEVRAIATASEEQAAASDEITRSIHDINNLTSATSQAMDIAAHSLQSLRDRSHELVDLINHMKEQ